MAKKLKKAKKGMSPEAKFTLGSSFKGLISNQAVIDGSKASPWWVAVIFLAFSAFLPLLPTFVQLSRVNGHAFIANLNYGLDQELAHFAYTERKNGEEFKIEGGHLTYYKGTQKAEFVNPNEEADYFINWRDEYHYENSHTHQYDFRVFFWTDNNLTDNANKIVNQKFIVGGKEHAAGVEGEKTYIPNILILTPTTMAVSLYKENSSTGAGTSYGGLDWLNSPTDLGLIERLIGKDGLEALGNDPANPKISEDTFVNKYSSYAIDAFKNICSEAYINQKAKTKWTNTGIYLGIYVGVIAFLGLMVFILTRGKNNPYKYLNVWECQKISWWGAASPAILGTILSLIFSGNAIGQMAFILLVSLRIMWLSMKQLRPVVQ